MGSSRTCGAVLTTSKSVLTRIISPVQETHNSTISGGMNGADIVDEGRKANQRTWRVDDGSLISAFLVPTAFKFHRWELREVHF